MVGRDVTCDGPPAGKLLATTIAGNPLLSMGPVGRMPQSLAFPIRRGRSGAGLHPLFTRHPAYGTRGRDRGPGSEPTTQRAGRWRRLSLPRTTTTCAASW